MGHLKKLTKPSFLLGGTVGGTRYKALRFITIRSPQFNPTHHSGPFLILLPLFTCRKSSLNRLNPFITAQVCWVVVVWVFRVVVVLQTFPAHFSVPASGAPLPLLSIPIHSPLVSNLVKSSIQKSKKQYTTFSPRPISHIKKDYCRGIAARDWIRKRRVNECRTFFHAITKLSLTLSALIPCHPSPPPPPPTPERFFLGQFTTALILHCSSYINFHCLSKKVRPFSANFSTSLPWMYSSFQPYFFATPLLHDNLPPHQLFSREDLLLHYFFTAGVLLAVIAYFIWLNSPSTSIFFTIHLPHSLLLPHKEFNADDLCIHSVGLFLNHLNCIYSLILHFFAEKIKSWMHCMQVSIMMHLSKKCTFNYCIISNIVFFLALNIFISVE